MFSRTAAKNGSGSGNGSDCGAGRCVCQSSITAQSMMNRAGGFTMSYPPQPFRRALERLIALGEAESEYRPRLLVMQERRNRDGGDAVLPYQSQGELTVGLTRDRRVVDHLKV